MGFLWPRFLLFLVLIPLLIAIYIWIWKQRQRFVVRYSSLSLMQGTGSNISWLRKHLPFLLFLVVLASLLGALSRPVASRPVLSARATVILTIDISRSMCSTDILPNRLAAVKTVARSFVEQPMVGTQIGMVVFAGFAEIVQKPTIDSALLEDTIENLTTGTSTAIGSAILASLDTIAQIDDRVEPTEPVTLFSSPESPHPPQIAQVTYLPHIIVLLTDGASNTGPPPLRAAEQAAERGVRIYPIGFGTMNSSVMNCGNTIYDDSSGSSGSESSIGVNLDTETLKQIADLTGGQYYSAASAGELQMVFQDLRRFITVTTETTEISVLFLALGALMAIAAFILSLLWRPLL